MTALYRRWLPIVTVVLCVLAQSGCICTEWRWIWENDDDHYCQKVDVHMQAPPDAGGAYTMSVAVPADH